MEVTKSLDEHMLVDALLCDVQTKHSDVFSLRALRLTQAKLEKRFAREGMGLLTKTFPRLAKALDRALTGDVPLNAVGFRKIPGSQLPRFLGELFQQVFSHDGWILPTPCVESVKSLRQVLFSFYKYELPYDESQIQAVLTSFVKTDDELANYNTACPNVDTCSIARSGCSAQMCREAHSLGVDIQKVIEKAQKALKRVFCNFDHRDIYPRHGPGGVSTKETGPQKYAFRVVSPRIEALYPIDEYLYACLSHVCDDVYRGGLPLRYAEVPAKVCLVSKDSRGPRLISEESLTSQWFQQGLMQAIVELVEAHELTCDHVFFTDQTPNQLAALLGSSPYLHQTVEHGWGRNESYALPVGKYATLDLKDASDRVSLGLVRLLFPQHLVEVLESVRSLSTKLPTKQVKVLNKHAPMGSAVCFPIMALAIWAILDSGVSDADARESIHVYGDDVIVPTAEAEDAIKLLEAFGLRVNRDKSCTKGFFRESCGLDAFRGKEVTPVKFKTVWASRRCAEVYSSWIAYANALYERSYFHAYDYIVGKLLAVYGEIPTKSLGISVPSLHDVPETHVPKCRRPARGRGGQNDYQTLETKVYDVVTRTDELEMYGWSMLLRYFVEGVGRPKREDVEQRKLSEAFFSLKLAGWQVPPTWRDCLDDKPPFSVRSYTPRRSSKLVRRWVMPGADQEIAAPEFGKRDLHSESSQVKTG